MLAGSTRMTLMPHGASSWRSACPSSPSAALVASSGPANGGRNRTPIVLIMTMSEFSVGKLPDNLPSTSS
ncbi:MAG TPA: hypothetical protein VLM05_14850, partial [Mycobacteriales bacterium]|nr:hypothetical protein [Mycobacteriales bacterium]